MDQTTITDSPRTVEKVVYSDLEIAFTINRYLQAQGQFRDATDAISTTRRKRNRHGVRVSNISAANERQALAVKLTQMNIKVMDNGELVGVDVKNGLLRGFDITNT